MDEYDCNYDPECMTSMEFEDYDPDDNDGPPECVQDCEGIENIDPESDSVEFCEYFIQTWGMPCTDDCDEDPEFIELSVMNYICGEYIDCEMMMEEDCEMWLDFKGDDSCEECHDACGNDNN